MDYARALTILDNLKYGREPIAPITKEELETLHSLKLVLIAPKQQRDIAQSVYNEIVCWNADVGRLERQIAVLEKRIQRLERHFWWKTEKAKKDVLLEIEMYAAAVEEKRHLLGEAQKFSDFFPALDEQEHHMAATTLSTQALVDSQCVGLSLYGHWVLESLQEKMKSADGEDEEEDKPSFEELVADLFANKARIAGVIASQHRFDAE